MNKYKYTILVIDDSAVIRAQLKDILTSFGYEALVAKDENAALEQIKNKKIHIVIIDVELKNSNGIDFLKNNHKLIVKDKKITPLVISSTINTETIKSSIKAGAVDTLKKPYVEEEVILKVNLWIDYKVKQNQVLQSKKMIKDYEETVNESFIVSKTNPKGIITYVNEKFCELSGYKKVELIGQNHNIVRHPDTPKKFYEDMWHTIKTLKKSWKGVVKNRRKDGKTYWVDSYIRPILNSKGEVVEYIGIKNDVTEQENAKSFFKQKFDSSSKDLDHYLSLSKEYEKAINVSNIVSRTDLKGFITYVNDKFCEISGYSKEELLGKNHNIIRHPDTPKQVFKTMWDTIKAGKTFHGVIKNRGKNSDYWIDTSIVPIFDENDEIVEFMGIRKDVTELFELNAEMDETQKEIIYKMGDNLDIEAFVIKEMVSEYQFTSVMTRSAVQPADQPMAATDQGQSLGPRGVGDAHGDAVGIAVERAAVAQGRKAVVAIVSDVIAARRGVVDHGIELDQQEFVVVVAVGVVHRAEVEHRIGAVAEACRRNGAARQREADRSARHTGRITRVAVDGRDSRH